MKKKTPGSLLTLHAWNQAAECLRTVAHPHRLRMLQIVIEEERTVGELARACKIPSHRASEHLRLMKDRGLLASERRGRRIYYRLAEPSMREILRCIEERFGGGRKR